MPDFKELFPKSFKARDFRDAPQVYTITSAEPRALTGKDESISVKLCIKFEETNRFWLAGPKEACPSIAEALGSTNTDDWIGQQIELYEAETEFGDDVVDCVRARKPAAAHAPAKRPKKQAARKKAKAVTFPRCTNRDEEAGTADVQLVDGGEIYEIPLEDLDDVLAGEIELE